MADTIIVIAIIAVAAVYLIRRQMRSARRPEEGCGCSTSGCSSCPMSKDQNDCPGEPLH